MYNRRTNSKYDVKGRDDVNEHTRTRTRAFSFIFDKTLVRFVYIRGTKNIYRDILSLGRAVVLEGTFLSKILNVRWTFISNWYV